MKIAFISDIHGVPSTLSAALKVIDTLEYDKLVFLGDLLYHGPRNGVPDFYDPVRVAAILNERKENIIAVRGNCDAEVDQMMVEFPIMEDYKVLEVEKIGGGGHWKFFLTHGHRFNERNRRRLGWPTCLFTDTRTFRSSRASRRTSAFSIPAPCRFRRAVVPAPSVTSMARNSNITRCLLRNQRVSDSSRTVLMFEVSYPRTEPRSGYDSEKREVMSVILPQGGTKMI